MTSQSEAIQHYAKDRSERTTERPISAERILWLDVAKGLGIVVVVAGHALGGILDSAAGQNLVLLRDIFLAIYVFHMSLFFFLSGLLVRARLARSRVAFLINLFLTVAYPYFLWSIIQYAAIYAAGSLVNRPVTMFWKPLLSLPFVSISQFWFLYVLFLLHLAAWLIVPRLGARAFFLIAAAGKLLLPLMTLPVMLHLSLVHGISYASGVFVGAGGIDALKRYLEQRMALTVAIILAAMVAILVASVMIILGHPEFAHLRSWEITGIAWRLPVFPASVIGVAGCLAIAFLIRGRLARGLTYIGQRTMAIFVLHVLFIAGTRIILTRFGHHPGAWLVLAACIIAGFAGPIAVNALASRLSGSRILGLG